MTDTPHVGDVIVPHWGDRIQIVVLDVVHVGDCGYMLVALDPNGCIERWIVDLIDWSVVDG